MKLLSPKVSPKKILSPLMNNLWEKREALRKFQAKHSTTFDAFDELNQAVQVAENELKTEAKKIGAGYETDVMSVEYTMPQHRYLSPKLVREYVDEKIINSLGIITKTESVDEKVLKALVRAKKVNKRILTAALIEEPTGSPRVTITFKEQDNGNEG